MNFRDLLQFFQFLSNSGTSAQVPSVSTKNCWKNDTVKMSHTVDIIGFFVLFSGGNLFSFISLKDFLDIMDTASRT